MTRKKSTKSTIDDRSDLQQFSLDVAHALGKETSPTKVRSSALYRTAKEILKEIPDLKAAGEYRGTEAWPNNLALLMHGGDVTFRVCLRATTIDVECEEWHAQVGSGEYVRIPGLLRTFLAGKAVTSRDRVGLDLAREAVSAAGVRNLQRYLRASADAAERLFPWSEHPSYGITGATHDPELQAMLDRIMKK